MAWRNLARRSSPCFCTDYRKVNKIINPDSFFVFVFFLYQGWRVVLIEWVRRSLSPSWIFSKATSKSPWLLRHQRFLSLWLLTTSYNIRSWPLGCETRQLCFRGLCRKYCQELLIVRLTWMILLSIHLYRQIMLKRWTVRLIGWLLPILL